MNRSYTRPADIVGLVSCELYSRFSKECSSHSAERGLRAENREALSDAN